MMGEAARLLRLAGRAPRACQRGHRRDNSGLSGCRFFGVRAQAEDQRGSYAMFISIIVAALMFLGGLAYDGPRVIAARHDAVHAANEAARVAAATIASGGTLEQAHAAAENRVGQTGLIYGQAVHVAFIDCAGSRVQATIVTGYVYRSSMRLIRVRQPIAAVGAAEARLLLPSGDPAPLHYLGECPLA